MSVLYVSGSVKGDRDWLLSGQGIANEYNADNSGILSVPSSPRNWQAIVLATHTYNDLSYDFTSVVYRTALYEVPLTKIVRHTAHSDESIALWLATLRWWETDEDGYLVYKWNGTKAPSEVAGFLLDGVRYSDPVEDTAVLTNAGSTTIAMSAGGLAITTIKVVGGAQDYNPTNGGVEIFDTINLGQVDSFAVATDDTGVPSNTWGWTHSGTGRDNLACAMSLYPAESPEPREIRVSRRGRHGLVVPSGWSV